MQQENPFREEEEAYLQKTLFFITAQIAKEQAELYNKQQQLMDYQKEIYENTSHHTQDFNKLTETVQYLEPLRIQELDYNASQQRLELYQKMLVSPYFARIDFYTEQWGTDTVYIGIGNLENEDTFESFVYDWRAPIASMYYQFELGPAHYSAPAGKIEGELTLKRQYEIENSTLQYFFDSNVNIADEILKQALAQNSSPYVKTIVETIQKEQDAIIRDTETDILIVQGVAGSGKTSIALHRAAYLMYQGLQGHLVARDMLLISPNHAFERYIAGVLPELGEKHIQTNTFEQLFYQFYPQHITIQKRNEMLEEMLTANEEQRTFLQQEQRFKASGVFLEILQRFIQYYGAHCIAFVDITYGGETIAQRELLKARFLHSDSSRLPLQVRLAHIEQYILDRVAEKRPRRLRKLEHFAMEHTNTTIDYKAQARLLNIKQVSALMRTVKAFTHLDYLSMYRTLFQSPHIWNTLTAGLTLPENLDAILQHTKERLSHNKISYSDGMALFFLRLSLDTVPTDLHMKQVVVDEAQDYSPLHFELLGKLYPNAKYTILGDVNQTVVEVDQTRFYNSVVQILQKKRAKTIQLSKSFRCSYEIATFAAQFSDQDIEIERMERYATPPMLLFFAEEQTLIQRMAALLLEWKTNYKNIAIICKSAKESVELFVKIRSFVPISLFTDEETTVEMGCLILPVYLAKGLEFDAVMVYNTNEKQYHTVDDRRMLYISCTRALHQLVLACTGAPSHFIGTQNCTVERE